jgi:acetyl esterase
MPGEGYQLAGAVPARETAPDPHREALRMSQYDFDPAFRDLLPVLPTTQPLDSVEKIREARSSRIMMFPAPPDRADVVKQDHQIAGPKGAPDVTVRVYRPKAPASGPRPGVFEIHGGGFMMGDIAMMDPWCQRVAAEIDAVVVSVEYRLAPEHPFPAGVEDCYAALVWTATEAKQLGIDPERIAIAGQSAGGGLAAATALLARDRGGPSICFQVLEIPELDDRLDTPSMLAFTDTPLWNRPNAVWSWKHYLGPDHQGEVSPYAAPARAENLAGLPPAYISTMEFDPLRDEGIIYGLRLLQAGVSVELHSYPGTFHGSALLPSADVSRRNTEEVFAALAQRLKR